MVELHEIQNELKTQDNEITADPIFVVFERIRFTGLDPLYSDDSNMCFVDSDRIFTIKEALTFLEENEAKTPEEILDLDQTVARMRKFDFIKSYYVTQERFKTLFFTRKGAEEYIKHNAHRLESPRMYVDSLHRNQEMIDLRNFLMENRLEAVKNE